MRNLHGSQHRLHAGKEVGGDHDLDGGMECLAVVWSCDSSKLEVWGLAFQPVLGWEPARSIPLRKFGRADAQISALGFGGHHQGEAPDEKNAVEIVHQAIDRGIRDEPLNGHGEAIKNVSIPLRKLRVPTGCL